MGSSKSDTPHVLLNLADLDADEKKRDELVGAIKKNAPNSPLFAASPAIQAQVGKVDQTNTDYKSAVALAAASKNKYLSDLAAARSSQGKANKALRLLAKLTENDAVSEADITGMAFTAYTGKPPAPPLVSPVVEYKPGSKGSGKATASVQGEPKKSHHRFAAEQSLDGTTWTKLPGGGKSRKLTGKTGTSVWVRFALERGQEQSEWSTPIQVIFP